MIDKLVTYASVICLLIHYASSAPAAMDINATRSESVSQNNDSDSGISAAASDRNSELDSVFESNRTEDNGTTSNSSDKSQMLVALPDTKSTSANARKNKNDLFFCCPEDEPVRGLSQRKNKDRERNTKPPVLKRGKNPEVDEPRFEKRPALLLRFFPDGTAVLISKFQLHLHVKPKQIKFEPDVDSKEIDDVDFNPGLILNDGKSYEVSYKRLEAAPSSREQNTFDLDESEERESYSEDIDLKDLEFVSTTKSSLDSEKPFPLLESTTPTTTAGTEPDTSIVGEGDKLNKSEKVTATVSDGAFFVMTSGEMSSLQQQYDPTLASPLKATMSLVKNVSKPELTPTVPSTTVTVKETIVTTESSKAHTATFPTTIKCLSFKNQLSLALSTEDNIDNSLLKRHIFPTEDCDSNLDVKSSDSLAKLQNSLTTSRQDSLLPIITRPTVEPTTPTYARNNLVPYLASQFSNHPSNADVVVVTSLPVLIDLKTTTRNRPVTDVPAWREVTVGVVRDQKGQPLKPRYNNWMAHLRGIRKDNKFWNDFTTPKPDFHPPHSRQPIIQNFHPSPSQVNPSFWRDLQNKGRSSLYRADPTRHYPVQIENDFHFWRTSRTPPNPSDGARWNHPGGNSKVPELRRGNEPGRNHHRSYESTESRQNPQWNDGRPKQNGRRW